VPLEETGRGASLVAAPAAELEKVRILAGATGPTGFRPETAVRSLLQPRMIPTTFQASS
jgi:hypothetical protein